MKEFIGLCTLADILCRKTGIDIHAGHGRCLLCEKWNYLK